MIIVDENIRGALVTHSIASWYPGRVMPVNDLRRETLVEDDGIATLLHQVRNPTFVTINVIDILRNLLHLPQFRTKAARMGKIIRVRSSGIEYYELDRQIHFLSWPT